MALVFKMGTMGSGKTLDLLATRHSYLSKGRAVGVVVPFVDERYGRGVVKSRSGFECKADKILELDECLTVSFFAKRPDLILVDEVQFLSAKSVESLLAVTREERIPIICYGIRTDFRSRLFEGSKRLLELADRVEMMTTLCSYCDNTASFNLRIDTFNTDQVLLGDSDVYREVCPDCYLAEIGEFE